VRSLTGRTQQSHETLSQYTIERGDKVVRLDAHVEKSSNHIDDVIRVDRGEDQVTRQSRLNRDLRRLLVTDLTDQYLVRIVAQYRTQSSRECESLLISLRAA